MDSSFFNILIYYKITTIGITTYETYITHLVDALRPRSAPLTVYPYWSHSTRQSFVESALASPPILRCYIYFPSSACIYLAGVSLPSKINLKTKRALGVVLC